MEWMRQKCYDLRKFLSCLIQSVACSVLYNNEATYCLAAETEESISFADTIHSPSWVVSYIHLPSSLQMSLKLFSVLSSHLLGNPRGRFT
jgi:hypothetical protein